MIKAIKPIAAYSVGSSILEVQPQTDERLETVKPSGNPVISAQADWINLYDWIQKRAERGAPFVKSNKNAKKKQYPGNKEGFCNWICGIFGLLSEYHNYPSPSPSYFGIKFPEMGKENCAVNLAQQSSTILVKPKALLEIYQTVRELGGYHGEDYLGFWDQVKEDIKTCPGKSPDQLKCQIGLYPDDAVAVQNSVMRIFERTDGASYSPRMPDKKHGEAAKKTPKP